MTNTHRARIAALLNYALGDNDWALISSDNGEPHWIDPVALNVSFTVPEPYTGYGSCDAGAGNPTVQAAFLLEQVLEEMYPDPVARAAVAQYAIMRAAEVVAERN